MRLSTGDCRRRCRRKEGRHGVVSGDGVGFCGRSEFVLAADVAEGRVMLWRRDLNAKMGVGGFAVVGAVAGGLGGKVQDGGDACSCVLLCGGGAKGTNGVH